jgi:MFS family permease
VTRLLRLAAYRRLLAAYTLNELAWGLGTLALSFLVYRRTGSAVGAAGFYLGAQFVPALSAPALVARVDHLPARMILPILYVSESLAFLAQAILVGHFNLVVVLLIAFFDGTIALTARPLARATTAAVTAPQGLLREGNAINNLCFSIAFMLGPALGGLVVATSGISTGLYIDAGVFLVIGLTLASSATLPAVRAPDHERSGRLRAAWAYTRERPTIRRLMGLQAVAILFFTISIPVEVVYAQHTLKAGAGGYGALMAAWGGGAVAGSAAYARWHGLPARALITAGAGALGVGLAAMALSPSLILAVVAAAVAGVGNGVEAVAARTALQELVEERWMAIVLSFSESLYEIAPGIGIVLGGTLAAVSTSRVALAVGAGGALVVAGVAWAVLNPQRRLIPATAEPPRR